jgi:hypothetical protein
MTVPSARSEALPPLLSEITSRTAGMSTWSCWARRTRSAAFFRFDIVMALLRSLVI